MAQLWQVPAALPAVPVHEGAAHHRRGVPRPRPARQTQVSALSSSPIHSRLAVARVIRLVSLSALLRSRRCGACSLHVFLNASLAVSATQRRQFAFLTLFARRPKMARCNSLQECMEQIAAAEKLNRGTDTLRLLSCDQLETCPDLRASSTGLCFTAVSDLDGDLCVCVHRAGGGPPVHARRLRQIPPGPFPSCCVCVC